MTLLPEVRTGTCANATCSVAADGSCALRHPDPLECPEYEPPEPEELVADETNTVLNDDQGRADAADLTTATGRSPVELSGETVNLHTAEALTVEEATRLMQERRAQIAVIVAPARTGKTTLLAALYEQFGRGETDGWHFVASRSLVGFERRSWLAQWESGGREPETPHTPLGTEQIFLHLAIQKSGDERRDLLLADLSGEYARMLVELDDTAAYAPALASATSLVIAVDGARLAHAPDRHRAVSDARVMARAIAEQNLLRPAAAVILVVTKWDLCDSVTGIHAELERLRADLATYYAREVRLLRTCARPNTSVPAGTDSLSSLLDAISVLPPTPPLVSPARVIHSRSAGNWTPGSPLLRRLMTARLRR
jgi:hypothetical protein